MNSRMKGLLRILSFFLLLAAATACKDEVWPDPVEFSRNFQEDMKAFLMGISSEAKTYDPAFCIVPNNAERLVTETGRHQDFPDLEYLEAIDGLGRDYLFYGYFGVDVLTPYYINGDILGYLEKIVIYEKPTLITDYCITPGKIDDSYSRNENNGFISYAAPTLELDRPAEYPSPPYRVNTVDTDSLHKVKNFLHIKQPGATGTRQEYLNAVSATDYDLLITDPFHNGIPFTIQEVESMKVKHSGQKRLVLAGMNIGRADISAYYWDTAWVTDPPAWLLDEDPDHPGHYRVRYWEPAWQEMIFRSENAYLRRILEAGFDGVFLYGAGAFQYFEDMESAGNSWE